MLKRVFCYVCSVVVILASLFSVSQVTRICEKKAQLTFEMFYLWLISACLILFCMIFGAAIVTFTMKSMNNRFINNLPNLIFMTFIGAYLIFSQYLIWHPVLGVLFPVWLIYITNLTLYNGSVLIGAVVVLLIISLRKNVKSDISEK